MDLQTYSKKLVLLEQYIENKWQRNQAYLGGLFCEWQLSLNQMIYKLNSLKKIKYKMIKNKNLSAYFNTNYI